jgi:hypothetical protein
VARVQGFIQEISYTDGDFVKKDTLLFTIEPEPYRLKLLAAQAAEAGSQATLKQAEAEYKRQAELASKQFASQAVLDQVEATRDSRGNLQQGRLTPSRRRQSGYTRRRRLRRTASRARQVSLGSSSRQPHRACDHRRGGSDLRDFTVSDVLMQQPCRGRQTQSTCSACRSKWLQNETDYPHHGVSGYGADHHANARRARQSAQRQWRPAARLFRARAFPTNRSRLCWSPIPRSTTRPAAMCLSSTPTMWWSSAASRPGSSSAICA